MRRTWVALVVITLAATLFAAGLWAEEKKPVKDDEIQKMTAAMPDAPCVKPAKARQLLVFTLTKGFPHDSVPVAAKAFEIMGEKTGAWTTVVSDDVQMFAPDKLKAFDAVMMDNTTGTLFTDETLKKSLVDFVKEGKGLAGCHAATDCFYDWKEFGDMMGGYFDGHPFGHISVKIDDTKSPLTKMFGGKGFDIRDEIYIFKTPYSREKLRILLSIDWENANLKKDKRADNDYALSWIQPYGKGRVFYCAFGHDHAIFWNKPVLQHFLAGIQYAMGDLKADSTPSAKMTLEAAPGPDLRPKQSAADVVDLKVYAAPAAAAPAADKDGWIVLFDGKDLANWQNAGGDKPGAGWAVKDGAMVRGANAGDIWTKQRFADFILDLEFKTEGNSGVFIRTDNPKDCVQTGIEMQVEKSGGKEKLGRNDVGSIYDCLAPSKNTVKDDDWNHVVITAKDNKITIVMNDEKTIDMDLNQWSEAKKNFDGSANKFNKALKDFKRDGNIGFQDHGANVAYRNVKIKDLKATAEPPAKSGRK